MTADFQTNLEAYVKLVQQLIDKHWSDCNFTFAQSPLIIAEEGTRYIKVMKQDI